MFKCKVCTLVFLLLQVLTGDLQAQTSDRAIEKLLLQEKQSLQRPAWKVAGIPARSIDQAYGFLILVWQYKTDAMQDSASYKQLNLHGWHIDYGQGQEAAAEFAIQKGWPFYVDHVAGKGILHLTPESGLKEIPTTGVAASRPWSLLDSKTMKTLKERLDKNLASIQKGPIVGVAFDDEISVGSFNSPLELDNSSLSLGIFRKWLPLQYPDEKSFHRAWGLSNSRIDELQPSTFESVRNQLNELPPAEWKLASWLDFRAFNDITLAVSLSELVRHSNERLPGVPAGVVGGHQPSAYSGFDYSQIRHALQWIEAYDIGGTNELLRSFWSQSPRPARTQTFFSSGNLATDQWFLWYYLAHGCRGVIAWPERNGRPWFEEGKIDPEIRKLSATFDAVQQAALSGLIDPETEPIFSPIAILYSHPSVQMGWAIDATAHGKTWPRRSSGLDNDCLSSGKNRIAWSRLFEDLGAQPIFIDTHELIAGELDRREIRLLVLGQCFALSLKECKAIENFVRGGGVVVADYGCGIVDEHGCGYSQSPLDSLFDIDRSRDEGWFDGKRRYEIDGEKFQEPFAARLPLEGCQLNAGQPLVDRTLKKADIRNRLEKGEAIYLNQSPTIYFDSKMRAGDIGKHWRQRVQGWLERIAWKEPVRLKRMDHKGFGVELLRYQKSNGDEIWAVVANPTRDVSADGPGSGTGLDEQFVALQLIWDMELQSLRDLRSGRDLNKIKSLEFELNPSEAMIFLVRTRGN